MEEPFFSVIIPTYKDWERLATCLSALENQSYPQDRFEIIVINNNPYDSTPKSLNMPLNCAIIKEEKPGSYCARNAGLKIAKGDIIAFTDSDCVPDRDWIKNAALFLRNNKEYSRIAGNIELFYKSARLSAAELYETIYAFKQEPLAKKGSSVTGNMITYRYVIDAVGGFNEGMLSGGDHEWAKRAQDSGFKIAFAPNVIIRHPARDKMAHLETKAKRVAGGRVVKDNKQQLRASYHLLLALRPPSGDLFSKIKTYGSNLDNYQKFKIYMVKYYLNLLSAIEEVKLSLGKGAERQ